VNGSAIRILQTAHQQHLAAVPHFMPDKDLQNAIETHLIAPHGGMGLLQIVFVSLLHEGDRLSAQRFELVDQLVR
jgi:hypothetical protein